MTCGDEAIGGARTGVPAAAVEKDDQAVRGAGGRRQIEIELLPRMRAVGEVAQPGQRRLRHAGIEQPRR